MAICSSILSYFLERTKIVKQNEPDENPMNFTSTCRTSDYI